MVGSVRLMTSQQSEPVHVSQVLRPEALFGKTHVSYSLPPLTAQLVTSERNCSLRYEMGKLLTKLLCSDRSTVVKFISQNRY